MANGKINSMTSTLVMAISNAKNQALGIRSILKIWKIML